MTKPLRHLLMASAVALVLLVTITPKTFSQSQNPSSTNSISTSLQLPGNYAIIPPANPEKAETGKTKSETETKPAEANAPVPAPQAGGIGGFSNRTVQRDRNGPRRENLQAIHVAGKHVNALIGGFDQGAGFGFGVELTTAEKLPVVELRARALVSTRFYRRFEAGVYVPHLFDSEKTHLDLWFNYQKRTRDNFFGIGPRTPDDSAETNFASDERSYNLVVSHDVAEKVQVGAYARLANTNAYRGKDDNDIPIDTFFSPNPAVTPITRFLPGLYTNAQIFSYGGFAELNFRNNEVGLPKGGYGYVRIASSEGKNDPITEFGWNEVELDGRAYIPLGSDFTSLALRAFVELRDPKDGRQIPFYEQAYFGGRSHGRGFRNFRFRGNNSLLFSVEPRRTVWKQSETKGLDAFVFGDGGQVWGDNRSNTNPLILANDKFRSENWRFSVGSGVQYRMSKSFAVRIEVGHSNEANMVFFSVGRGF